MAYSSIKINKTRFISLILIFALVTFLNTKSKGQTIFPFNKNGNWFFVDTLLKRIDRNSYSFIKPGEKEYFYVSKNSKYALVNKSGKRITDFKFKNIYYNRYENLFCASTNDSSFAVDMNGKISPYKFGGYCGTTGGIVIWYMTYKKDGKIGFLKEDFKNGKHIWDSLPAIYDNMLDNYNGTATVQINGLWGIIDRNSEYVLEPQFDKIIQDLNSQNNLNGLIVIKKGLYGWLDPDAKIIIAPKYKDLTPFKNGYSFVKTFDNKSGYITYKGRELFK